jgi:hypothetical protein
MKALRRVSISLAVGRIDHVSVIGGHLVMQALGRVGKQVPVLMHRTSLYRCVPKIRFCNIGDEDRRGQAVM